MHRWGCALIGGIVLSLAVAACAGTAPASDAAQPRLGDDLVVRASDLCADTTARLDGVEWPDDERLTLEGSAPAIAATARIHRDLLDALARVSASASERAALDGLVAAGTRLVAALDELQAVGTRGDPAAFDAQLTEVSARAGDAAAVSAGIGLTACYGADG